MTRQNDLASSTECRQESGLGTQNNVHRLLGQRQGHSEATEVEAAQAQAAWSRSVENLHLELWCGIPRIPLDPKCHPKACQPDH